MHYHFVRIDEEGEHVDPALTFDRQDEAEERAVAVAREIDGPGWSGKRYPRPLVAASGACGVHRPPRPRAEGAAPRALDRALRRARPGARARLLCVAGRLAVVEGPLTPVARAAGEVMVMGARAAADATLGGVEGGGRRGAAPRAAVDPSRLTARVALLLEETAHQGLLALQLLVKARDLLARFAASDDQKVAALVVDLEQRVVALEREGRERLRQARRLLQGARRARA